jgi:hypothetical protein
MDLDGLDLLNSSDDRDSRASGTRESSEKEADSKSTSMERKDGAKSRHYHSFSMDSFMGKFNLAADDESPKLSLPSPSADFTRTGSGSLQGDVVALFDMEFANGEYTEAEKRKSWQMSVLRR